MKYERECLICGAPTGYANEVNVGVGIIRSNEPPICESCYNSKNKEVMQEIENINNNRKGLPF